MSNRRKRDERMSRGTSMRRERERAEAQRRRRTVAVIVAAIVVIVVGAGAAVFAAQRGGGGETPHEMTSDYGVVYSADSIDEKVEGITPVKLVFYEDFICPACKSFEDQVGTYVEEQVKRGVISVEYRPIAFLDDASTTDYSSRAANAAACVFDSAGAAVFQRFHDILFANQPPEGGPGLDDETLIQMADQAGADDVESCIDNQEFEDVVIDATDAASQNNVVETPTILVGGKELESSEKGTVPGLEDLVNAVLAAGARTPVSPSEPGPTEPSASESPPDKRR